MNIDFHYGVIYIVARIAGLDVPAATTVAHACQYIDDSTVDGVLYFSGGESYSRVASAHSLFDYQNVFAARDKLVWVPFHFLPGGEGETLEDKSVCRPNSLIAQAMVREGIRDPHAENALHRLGVTLHVYIDTWAHQGFSGTISKHNQVHNLSSHHIDTNSWLTQLESFTEDVSNRIKSETIDHLERLGHGAALHLPDLPWANWQYTNGHGLKIERDNLPQFIEAADMAHRVVRGFLRGNANFMEEEGLPESIKHALEELLGSNRDENANNRLHSVMSAVASGAIPMLREPVPEYIAKGVGSWKYQATGITSDKDDGPTKPAWSEKFESSDYRKFHDAVKEHLFMVTQTVLPAHGVRLV
ncbi:DUF6765 family protein [Dyella sp. 2HG41-7]|uniref:DUF6765 family protein n=1 Tax=Dyella sp. 2HG41-7 TaxID=2883239 RepID=UPI001F22ACCF|nr:DUF6765 family protein [Dyella sp. 2HG41-7]